MFTPTYHQRNLDNLAKLAPKTKEKAMQWYNWCISNGIDILITETKRTEEQQRQYVASGKSKTLQSYHLVGQALDFVPVINGKADYNAYSRPEIQKAISYAKSLGFTWGGDWDNDGQTKDEKFVDMPHLQYDKIPYGQDVEKPKQVTPVQKVDAVSDSAVAPYPGKPIKLGDKGKDVERIQRALKLKVDGIFGPQTEKAVKAYQKRKGLSADGIVGLKTWNTLF
ncbi:peptidoglycan-binding protein [Geobacillus kaustophilus]|uniref:peptidoglycan-binding protein n=1 Tax=Geobacillus kaustophilus TaxID=1462 RepID=UPI0005CCE4AA|nr:peptidoglycan-binding protein [Geobacillus kaustophilus]